MRVPVLRGLIRRRLLINFRADPKWIRKILPHPFLPKIHKDYSLVGICLIRLERIRPRGFPEFLSLSSENAAHRMAVEWRNEKGILCEGVFIPRRDTDSILNQMVGGRLFPGEHQGARFWVKEEGNAIDFRMKSRDGQISIHISGVENQTFSQSSCFASLSEASEFFKQGSLGYSVTRKAGVFDGMKLRTMDWKVSHLEVSKVLSSYYTNSEYFPKGTVEFDHALIMRNIDHEWHDQDSLCGDCNDLEKTESSE